jgi:hypothetical protein
MSFSGVCTYLHSSNCRFVRVRMYVCSSTTDRRCPPGAVETRHSLPQHRPVEGNQVRGYVLGGVECVSEVLCVHIYVCAYVEIWDIWWCVNIRFMQHKIPKHETPKKITQKTHTSIQTQNREGPQLDALVSAATDLAHTQRTDVYWKTTTSRAVGHVWVGGKRGRIYIVIWVLAWVCWLVH